MQFVRGVVRVLTMRCCEHAELISRQLDEPLPRGEAFGLRLHIVICAGCRRMREQLVQIRQLARALAAYDTRDDARMPKEARARIGAALSERTRPPGT